MRAGPSIQFELPLRECRQRFRLSFTKHAQVAFIP
jgi:hypothetical protein